MPASKEEESELSGIPVENAVFISHDKDLKERSDVEPGMMIRFTVPDNYQDLIGYGYFNQTSLIETWGKYQNDLYRTGLNELREYKEMENGLNY